MAKKKKKKKFAYKGKIMSAARRIWLHSPLRREAINRDKTSDGYHRCARCRKLTDQVHIDHVEPIVPVTGFDSWDNVFQRLYCPSEELQKLCQSCHSAKTLRENIQRKDNRRKKLNK